VEDVQVQRDRLRSEPLKRLPRVGGDVARADRIERDGAEEVAEMVERGPIREDRARLPLPARLSLLEPRVGVLAEGQGPRPGGEPNAAALAAPTDP
jgi:hypothetical protein